MRILLFSGKGGVGKTSVAAATGVRLAQLGYRTLVMSVDPAHSLGDAFDLGGALFHGTTADPKLISDKLWIQEVNIQREIKRHWNEIAGYITSVLRTTGLSDVEAEEMAIFPGMEELSAMMYVNQYRRDAQFDIIVLDCAPTAESLRFISLPTTLDWYVKHVFTLERTVMKAVRPIMKRIGPMEAPPDSYFANIEDLFHKVEGIDRVLEDPQITSVRLVTNPEKMVLRETQRAFVYFSLHGLTVDSVIVNRMFPEEIHDPFFTGWLESQSKVLSEIEAYFAPVPISTVPLFKREVLSYDGLLALSDHLYRKTQDPSLITITERPYSFARVGDHYEVRLNFPFVEKSEIGLFKKDDDLVVEVGDHSPAHWPADFDVGTDPDESETGREYAGGGDEERDMNENTESQTSGGCGCKGNGPRFTAWAKGLEPPPAVRDHFRQAGIEFLKGLREIVDHRIQRLARTEAKGTKVTVE